MGTASIKQSCLCQTGLSSHLYFWHVGTVTPSPECQSAQMSKITNGGLTQSGTGCFIAVPIWQQWASKDSFFLCESSQERSKLICMQGEDTEVIVHILSNRISYYIVSNITPSSLYWILCISIIVVKLTKSPYSPPPLHSTHQCHHLGQQCQQHDDEEWVSRV